MLLAIDAGNTNIVFGLYDGETWRHVWRLETHPLRPFADYGMFLRMHLLEAGLRLDDVQRTVLSSVVPAAVEPLQQAIKALLKREALWLRAEVYPQLPVRTERPYEIGSDLVANALAAYERFHEYCMVVDFGTALTFTIVSDRGDILGVTIAPGLKTAIRALAGNTAQLPEVPLELPHSAIGRSTVHAIQAGILYGYTGMVEGMIRRINTELDQKCRVMATGGLSSILTTLHDQFDEVDPNLTLDGLRWVDYYAHR
ncbi:type III pantothenate kinase [Catalinimonas alkaloidigena]|uniref:Type III pantothenate kinase n=1 Tax=Catalinimonas alkaloidigena TaxID=1075417 RepID=A0A1G9RCH1_9BACT|nr:type III pantothenate kinase [Catalinimonas alkaloidigena]SDM20966.1 type III pantothenate kinase [Catalinimonas alkaloidigena]